MKHPTFWWTVIGHPDVLSSKPHTLVSKRVWLLVPKDILFFLCSLWVQLGWSFPGPGDLLERSYLEKEAGLSSACGSFGFVFGSSSQQRLPAWLTGLLCPLTDFSKAAIVHTQATHGHSSDSLVDSGRPQCGLKSSKEPPRGNLQGWRHRWPRLQELHGQSVTVALSPSYRDHF